MDQSARNYQAIVLNWALYKLLDQFAPICQVIVWWVQFTHKKIRIENIHATFLGNNMERENLQERLKRKKKLIKSYRKNFERNKIQKQNFGSKKWKSWRKFFGINNCRTKVIEENLYTGKKLWKIFTKEKNIRKYNFGRKNWSKF